MKISRGDFLKTSLGIAGLALLHAPSLKAAAKAASSKSDVAMLVDVSKCIGCWWCYAACKNYNNLTETIKPDPEQAPELSPETWTTLYTLKTNDDWSFRKQACMHCTDAACVKVCPSGALSYNDLGFVQYDKDKCIGCGYCAEFCPFEVPKLKDDKITGVGLMAKCTFCKDRVTNGQQPACAEACPTGAIKFGNRSELLEEGKQRVMELSRSNPESRLYGEHELDGLHVLYVLPDQPSVYGLPEEPQLPATATIQKDIFRPLTWIVWGAVAAGLALNVLVARAMQLRRKEED